MNCAHCGAENPANAKFCMSCGTATSLTCASCSTELPVDARFCFACGTPIAPDAQPEPQTQSDSTASPSQLERLKQYIPQELLAKLETAQSGHEMLGERRVVTMLFCDVQGSTAAANSMDPEEWAEIINGAFEHLISPVYRYEGTLARLMGDGILAFFGAPVAHEDDPQRGVLAGLGILEAMEPYSAEIKEKWGIDLAVRVGINTGLVVVGEVGSDLRVEYTALGDAINMAARMEQTAAPRTLQITENTYRLVEPFFDFEDLGEVEVRGSADPIRSFRVNGVLVEPGQMRGIRGLDSPMIGRDGEFDRLKSATEEVTNGRGQLVALMGDAGLGKSRLLAELRKHIETDTDALWLEGRSLSYETEVPYSPFNDVFRSAISSVDSAPGEPDYLRLKSALTALSPETGTSTAHHIAAIMGISVTGPDSDRVRFLDPPHAKARTFGAAVELLESITQERAVILVLDDLHWADPTSTELLAELMPLTDRAKLMLIGAFRPWRDARSWEFRELASRQFPHCFTEIEISPLDDSEVGSLVEGLLKIDGLPDKVEQLIFEKAEGNPFFVEEIIRSLIDRGLVSRDGERWMASDQIDQFDVPDTLNGVLTSRMDSLNDASKRLLQVASVAGREFEAPVVESVVGIGQEWNTAVLDLQRRELIRETSRVPVRSFIFKNAMTQEAAYASLLLSDRRSLHGQIAEQIETTHPDRVAELARHFLEARDHERALPFLADAAAQSADAYATDEAISLYQRACEIVERSGTDADNAVARRVFEGLGGALGFAGRTDEAIGVYRRMSDMAARLEDDEMAVSAMNKTAFQYALGKGELDFAQQTLEQAEVKALSCDDLAGQAERHMTNCYIQTTLGDFDKAYASLDTAERLGRRTGSVETRLFGMTHIANTLTFMTRFDEALEIAQEALDLAIESGNRAFEAELKAFSIPFYYLCQAQFSKAEEIAGEALVLAANIGASQAEVDAAYAIAATARMTGKFDVAIEAAGRVAEVGKDAGLTYAAAAGYALEAATGVELDVGRVDESRALETEAFKFMDMPVGTAMGALVWADTGFARLLTGDVNTASRFFESGLATSSAPRLLARPQLLLGKAMVSLLTDSLDQADELVAEADTFASEARLVHYTPYVSLTRGMIEASKEQSEEADSHYREACMTATELRMFPTAIQASVLRAEMHNAAGESAGTQSALEEAEHAISQVSLSIKAEEVRQAFLNTTRSRLASLS